MTIVPSPCTIHLKVEKMESNLDFSQTWNSVHKKERNLTASGKALVVI